MEGEPAGDDRNGLLELRLRVSPVAGFGSTVEKIRKVSYFGLKERRESKKTWKLPSLRKGKVGSARQTIKQTRNRLH
jgi:hypothetical protein